MREKYWFRRRTLRYPKLERGGHWTTVTHLDILSMHYQWDESGPAQCCSWCHFEVGQQSVDEHAMADPISNRPQTDRQRQYCSTSSLGTARVELLDISLKVLPPLSATNRATVGGCLNMGAHVGHARDAYGIIDGALVDDDASSLAGSEGLSWPPTAVVFLMHRHRVSNGTLRSI
jgi:hypothetical protein